MKNQEMHNMLYTDIKKLEAELRPIKYRSESRPDDVQLKRQVRDLTRNIQTLKAAMRIYQ